MRDKILVTVSLCVLIPISVLLIGTLDAVAQKKTPAPQNVVLPDSVAQIQKETPPQTKTPLPALDLREYTITGREKMQVLPSQRKNIELSDVTTRERIIEIEGRNEYTPPGAGGEKSEKTFDTPLTGVINEVYGSFGKYTDINAGLKLRKKFVDEEFFANIDYRKSNGHVFNADFYDFTGDMANIHDLYDGIQNRTELKFGINEYMFYGSSSNSGRKRKIINIDAASIFQFSRWEPVDIRVEFGGRYVDPDATDIFNWDLWSRINFNSLVYSTLISGVIELNTDRIKDGDFDNAPLSDANYAKTQLTIERLLTPRVHLRVGGSYYYYYSKNANPDFVVSQSSIDFIQRVLVTRKDNKFYPLAALTYDMDDLGRLFVEFEPTVESVALLDKLQFNPYLDVLSPLSHEVMSHSFKIGWKRSYAHDLAFEIAYNDKRIENYGFLIDNGFGISMVPDGMDGMWSYIYDNTLDINEYSGVVNWNPHPRFNAWSSARYIDVTIVESKFTAHVPYLPRITVDYSLQFMPGHGFQFIIDGQYVGKRYAHPIDVPGGTKMDKYVLTNMTLNKQWNRQLGTYIYVSNIFNEEYEIWKNYLAPDFSGGAGLRFFW